MKIRIGYDMIYSCPQPVPMILMLNVHYSRVPDVDRPGPPAAPIRRCRITAYRDGFGNWCTRLVAPAGDLRIFAEGHRARHRARRRGRA